MPSCKERRQHPRVRIKLPVVGRAKNVLVDGEIEDLSLGGAYIRCSTIPDVQGTFYLAISARGRLMSINVEMVWLDGSKLSSHTAVRGMGVRFRQLFNGDRKFLLDEIAKRHKRRSAAWL